jgi:tRNA nucleotidyltransferase (CCA-adding enzyme)
LQAAGFRAVGRDFPVFLHPDTHEEHALARLERKVGPGYRGFTTEFSPKVTLEEDLKRRDLTVNAIAQSANGRLIDPYGGQSDLRARVLRHVSPAFGEDPLRILRVARFAARFASLGFSVAPETLALMRKMSENDELVTLSAERVWRETERALNTTQPERYFAVLRSCNALARTLPDLDALLQRSPQGPTALGALRIAADAGSDGTVRWSALAADLGKHELDALHARLRTPNNYSELAALSRRLGTLLHAGHHSAGQYLSNAAGLLKLIETADAIRRPDRFAAWLQVLRARSLASNVPARTVDALQSRLERAIKLLVKVKLGKTELENNEGPRIAELLHARRLDALDKLK